MFALRITKRERAYTVHPSRESDRRALPPREVSELCGQSREGPMMRTKLKTRMAIAASRGVVESPALRRLRILPNTNFAIFSKKCLSNRLKIHIIVYWKQISLIKHVVERSVKRSVEKGQPKSNLSTVVLTQNILCNNIPKMKVQNETK